MGGGQAFIGQRHVCLGGSVNMLSVGFRFHRRMLTRHANALRDDVDFIAKTLDL